MKLFILAACSLFAASSTFADIILVGPAPAGGAGLGNRNTALSLQSPRNGTIETGCVGPNETTTNCGFANSAVKTGEGQIGSFTIGDLALNSLADLRIVFNAAEPGNSTGITLQQLALTLYDTVGQTSATFTLANPMFLDAAFLGVGQEGYLFRLDDAQAAQANGFAGGNTNIVLGLGAVVGCEGTACIGGVGAGIDTFSLTNAVVTADPLSPVPEPSTWMLLLSGGVLVSVKRFRKAN